MAVAAAKAIKKLMQTLQKKIRLYDETQQLGSKVGEQCMQTLILVMFIGRVARKAVCANIDRGSNLTMITLLWIWERVFTVISPARLLYQ